MTRPSFRLTPIAETGDLFSDFSPYVASVNNHGTVAFQASLRQGGSGVYAGNGGAPAPVTEGSHLHVASHPDIDAEGSTSFYVDIGRGGAVVLVQRGNSSILVSTDGPFRRIGPLGPTMNDHATVAFRADMKSGASSLFTASPDRVERVAVAGERFSGFEGLPVIGHDGSVVFRANFKDGVQGICIWRGGAVDTIVTTGDTFSSLASFPCVNDSGTIVFAAMLRTGGSGVFLARDRELTCVADTSGPFESFRGALVGNMGSVVFFATSRTADPYLHRAPAQLGIFTGPDPIEDRVLALGDVLFGSTIVDFALNPVSINDVNQLAVRLRLSDGRQLIVRADPVL